MQAYYVGEESLCQRLRRVWVSEGDEVAVLAEAVDDSEDHRLPLDTGQGFHKIEANISPDDGGDW